jgi:hypothetical protein
MKKLIILSAVMIYTTFTATSQTLPYRPFSQFNNEIGAYLLYNFDKRGDVYKGKTFSELIKDMELKPLDFLPIFRTGPSTSQFAGISLCFSFISTTHYIPWKDEFITIMWETPLESSLILSLIKTYPREKWVSQHYDFFKDLKIDVVKYK